MNDSGLSCLVIAPEIHIVILASSLWPILSAPPQNPCAMCEFYVAVSGVIEMANVTS